MIHLELLKRKQLKIFIQKLQTTSFNLGRIPDAFQIEGGVTTTKIECLDLLRSFPELTGNQFENDQYLINYLKNPTNLEHLLNQLDPAERLEFAELLQKQPVPIKAINEQPNTPTAAEQNTPTQTPASGGNMPFSVPSTGDQPFGAYQIDHNIPQESPSPVSGMEGGAGQGTAVTKKMQKIQNQAEIEKAGAVTVKANRLQATERSVLAKTETSLKFRAGFINLSNKFGSKVGVFFQRNIGKYLTEDRMINFLGKLGNTGINLFSSMAGLNSGIGSRSIMGKFGRFGSFGKGSNAMIRAGSIVKKGGLLMFLLAVIVFISLVGLLAVIGSSQSTTNPSSSPYPSPIVSALPSTTPIISSDISNCKFTRSDQSPKETTYQSPTILSYFQQASTKSSIPAAILAAFTRVESPSLAYKTDSDLVSMGCPESSTGALGIMQLQPQGTKGHDAGAITQGAAFIGKQYSELTRDDYCDPQKSILMGAGFILKKMSYFGYGTGTEWNSSWTNDKTAIDKLVEGYYGCIRYGSGDDAKNSCSDPGRKFSYGDDVWTSLQNCQVPTSPTPVSTTTPANARPSAPAIEKDRLKNSLISQFGITMNGFDTDHLQWAWEKLWDVSNTKFIGLTRGSVVTEDSYSSSQVGCPGSGVAVYLRQYPEELFKYALIHELGHVVRNCTQLSISFFREHLNALDQEKGITYYANNAWNCTRSDNPSEDYAEMIARYLNPFFSLQFLRGNGADCLPPTTEAINLQTRFPIHYNVVKAILGEY